MADNGSYFDLTVFPAGWFAPEAQPQGWFDRDQLDPVAATGNATAPGATVSEVYSEIAGTASGQINATASGATVSYAYSEVAGTATGQVNATAAGATVSEVYSELGGAASGGVAATASGATVGYVFAIEGGMALAEGNQIPGSGGTWKRTKAARAYTKAKDEDDLIYQIRKLLEKPAAKKVLRSLPVPQKPDTPGEAVEAALETAAALRAKQALTGKLRQADTTLVSQLIGFANRLALLARIETARRLEIEALEQAAYQAFVDDEEDLMLILMAA